MVSLEKIIKGCQQNRMKYQKMLYDMFADKMFGICIRYAKTREEAEDTFQEGFVRVFKHIDKYSFTGSFEGWMRKIFLNTAISNFRKNSKNYFRAEIDSVEYSTTPDTFENLEFTEEELLALINELPEGYRIVFNLYAIEGYKHKEIAELLDIDENTSKTQLFRARNYLKQRLTELKKQKKILVNERKKEH